MTLTFFTDNGYLVMNANVVEVAKTDICHPIDTHVASVECFGGWWEVYNCCGKLCAFWDADDSI